MVVIVPDLLPDSTRRQVLDIITPSKKEVQKQEETISILKSALHVRADTAEYSYSFIEPQGSTGKKQTQLSGAADIDLFVALRPEEYEEILRLPSEQRHQALDKLMSKLVSDWFEPALNGLDVESVQRAFSQHPFLSLKMASIDVDILGCFDIDADTLAREGPITAVDRTVHHTRYIASRLTETKRENARILKSFVRACHAYGDTCAVGRMGLTGVALELLVVYNNTLRDAIEALRMLDKRPVDVCNRTLEELQHIKKFQDDFLFLIDPTDTNRNISSSFSRRAYRWVQYQIDRLYGTLATNDNVIDLLLESPIPATKLPDWFIPHSAAYEFQGNKGIHYTILRDKLHSLARKIRFEMTSERTGEMRFGRVMTEILFDNGHYALGVLVERPQISSTYIRRGPPISIDDAAKHFREQHKNVKERDGYLYIKVKREWHTFTAMVEYLLKENEIEGLKQSESPTILSDKVLNVLYRYVLPIEPEFEEKITRVKEKENTSSE